ncbi:MAG: hypothetical protein ABIH87_03695 [bacterium]
MLNKQKYIIIIIATMLIIAGFGCNDKSPNPDDLDSSKIYKIDQTDKHQAIITIPGSWPGTDGSISVGADVQIISKGAHKNQAGALYGFLAEWEIEYNYTEQWKEYTFDTGNVAMGKCTVTPTTIKYKAKLAFNLDKFDKDGYFSVITEPISAEVKPTFMTCLTTFGSQTIPFEGFVKKDAPQIIKGQIMNMNENGAELSFIGNYIYDSQGYKIIDKPVILKIKPNN